MSAKETRAPRWRRMLAALTNASIAAAAAWGVRRRRRAHFKHEHLPPSPLQSSSSEPSRALAWRLFEPVAQFAEEQLGTPGQLAFGLRLVDRRTGRRVALWRSLVLLAAACAGELLARRVTPVETAEDRDRRERYMAGLAEISRSHPEDRAAREAAQRELFARYPRPHVARAIAPQLAARLLTSWLRRRLAPTVQVLAGRGGAQSP